MTMQIPLVPHLALLGAEAIDNLCDTIENILFACCLWQFLHCFEAEHCQNKWWANMFMLQAISICEQMPQIDSMSEPQHTGNSSNSIK